MSQSKSAAAAKAEKLRKRIAILEAELESLRSQLSKLPGFTGGPPVVSGLDMLWKAALPIARTRSSKHRCRTEWNRIPKAERPRIEDMIESLKKWNRCPEWKQDANQFVPALHRWIKERRWEDTPEVSEPASRYRQPSKPTTQPPTEADAEAVTNREDIRSLLGLKPLRINS